MIRLTLAQLRRSGARLVAAGVAIALGSAFITAVLLGSNLVRDTTYRAVTASLADADATLWRMDPFDRTEIETLAELDGVDAIHPVASVTAQLVAGTEADSAVATAASAEPALSPYELLEGTLPQTPDDVTLSVDTAERLGVEVGDRVDVTVDGLERQRTTVSGIIEEPSSLLGGATVLLHDETVYTAAGGYNDVLFTAEPGTTPEELASTVYDATAGAGMELTVVRTAELEAQMTTASLTGSEKTLTVLGMGFASVAMVVAALVIANTFQVLIAQRTRTLALLRCVGATKAQVRRSVVVEALVLGAGAGVVGLVLGLVVAQAALWYLGSVDLGFEVPGTLTLTPAVMIVPVLTGIVVTVLAALAPARVATRVAPLAALRPVDPPTVGRRGSRRRLRLALLLLLPGVLLLAGSSLATVTMDTGDNLDLLLAAGVLGGMLTLSGVLLGAVFFVPGVTRSLGRLGGLVTGRSRTVDLATVNAVRNPRRTSATASALVIGVALVVMMATGATTAQRTLATQLDSSFPVDLQVESPDGNGLTQEHVSAVADTAGVARTLAVPGVNAVATGEGGDVELRVLAIDPAGAAGVLRHSGNLTGLAEGTVLMGPRLAELIGVDDGETLALRGPDGTTELTTVIGASIEGSLTVMPDDMEGLADVPPTQLVWASMTGGADPADVSEAAQNAVAAATTGDAGVPYTIAPAAEREAFAQIIDTLLAIVLALLGVAVVISLVGVANTLSLSVIERRREHALLRAIGLTRRQLRGTLAVEGVLIAVTGGVVGTVLGLAFGWAGSTVMIGGMGEVELAVPWAALVGVAVVTVLAGLLASVLPARSAVRTPPVAALGAE